MNLTEYYRRHPRLLNEKSAYLEKEFLESVFYPEFGSAGLERLDYQKKIYDSNHRRSYYIDFVVRSDEKRYAIELDGYNYHGKLSAKEFEKQEERTNEITRQGYELIRFSFYKIKNKPAEVRRELRQRINLPQTEDKVSYDDGIVYGANWNAKKKGPSSWAIAFAILAVFFGVFLGLPLLIHTFSNTQNSNSSSNASTKTDASGLQRNHIDSFINEHNSTSSYKISGLIEINVDDESGQYYRKTNTYGSTQGNDKLVAMHGYIDKSDIWIISCSSTNPTSMRIYAESKDYNLLVDLIHTSVPYLNPHSTDNAERLKRFDNMIQSSRTGLYIENVNGTYTVLKQNDTNQVVVDKDKAVNWRLNMNTGCFDIMY